MKAITMILATCAMAILLSSCEKADSTVKFRNRSVTNSTYTIVWDGSAIATLGPQQDSEEFSFSAGPHTLEWRVSNIGVTACSPSNPVLSSNYENTFTCSQ